MSLWVEWNEWFWDMVRATNGSFLTFAGACAASFIAFGGVFLTVSSANRRAVADRSIVDSREREAGRHDRFLRVVEKLASVDTTIRMGALLSLSALADEWDQEARRNIKSQTKKIIQIYRDTKEENAFRAARRAGKALETERKNRQTINILERERLRQITDQRRRQFYKLRLISQSDLPTLAKDAMGQRDACIELLCAYLRGDPIRVNDDDPLKGSNGKSTENVIRTTSRASWNVAPKNLPDREARSVAVRILREHTVWDAQYPWPGDGLDLSGAHLQYARLAGSNMDRAQFEGAHLEYADLNGASLKYARFERANLEYAQINRAHLDHAWFYFAHMKHVALVRSHLRQTNLIYADLEHATFGDAHMNYCILNGAHLSHASLNNTHLENSWVSGADFSNAKMYGAHLSNTDMSQAILGTLEDGNEAQFVHVRGKKIDPITWDEKTKWPKGFDPVIVVQRQSDQQRTPINKSEKLNEPLKDIL